MDNAFHKRQVHSLIIMSKVNPAANAFEHIDPDAGIFEHILAAEIVKLFNAVFFNLFATGNAQLLFGRHFGRQAVAIPAQPALNLFAVHGLKTCYNIFDIRHHNMPIVRRSVGKRRAVIKDKFSGTIAVVHRFFKSFIFFPKF